MEGRDQLCLQCNSVNSRKKVIHCAACNGVYHLSCMGLTRNQAAVIVRWTCLGCLGRTEPEQRAEPDVDLARYITECRSKGGVLLIIPKGAIITVADAMQKLLDRVIQEGFLTAWGKTPGVLLLGYQTTGRPEE